MPEWTEKPYEFDVGYLTGWGFTKDWSSPSLPSKLKEVKSTIWPQYFCQIVEQEAASHFEQADPTHYDNYQPITS